MKVEKLADKTVFSDKTFTKRVLFNEDKVLNFVLNLKPGQTLPPHTHESSELIVHVITGEGDVTVDKNVHKVSGGDVLFCKGEEVFSVKNTGEADMSCFVIIAPNPSAVYSKEI
jgi:quercetin dioxygenase-like cupin family protein